MNARTSTLPFVTALVLGALSGCAKKETPRPDVIAITAPTPSVFISASSSPTQGAKSAAGAAPRSTTDIAQ